LQSVSNTFKARCEFAPPGFKLKGCLPLEAIVILSPVIVAEKPSREHNIKLVRASYISGGQVEFPINNVCIGQNNKIMSGDLVWGRGHVHEAPLADTLTNDVERLKNTTCGPVYYQESLSHIERFAGDFSVSFDDAAQLHIKVLLTGQDIVQRTPLGKGARVTTVTSAFDCLALPDGDSSTRDRRATVYIVLVERGDQTLYDVVAFELAVW
jgi:hypothetical protein